MASNTIYMLLTLISNLDLFGLLTPTVSPHFALSIGSATLSETTYNETGFTIG